ncbi:dolichol monophosphate mannose synthase [Streptomyces spiroverticillatus]
MVVVFAGRFLVVDRWLYGRRGAGVLGSGTTAPATSGTSLHR